VETLEPPAPAAELVDLQFTVTVQIRRTDKPCPLRADIRQRDFVVPIGVKEPIRARQARRIAFGVASSVDCAFTGLTAIAAANAPATASFNMLGDAIL